MSGRSDLHLVYFSSDPAFSIDRDLRVMAWNQGAVDLLGYAENEVIGQPCYAVLQAVGPDGSPICAADCTGQHCFASHKPFAVETCLCVHKDGRRIEVSLASVAVPPSYAKDKTLAVVFLRPVKNPTSATATTARVRAFMFGRFMLYVGDRAVPLRTWSRRQSVTLLKYLLHQRGKPALRDALIELLWPETEPGEGRERLKVVVYSLRQALRASGAPMDVVLQPTGSYDLVSEGLWTDMGALEDLLAAAERFVAQGRHEEAFRCYEEADSLYRGDYLADDAYADWCALERERLRETYLMMLEKLATLQAAAENYDKAIFTCRKALALDPCRECFHRILMMDLWSSGHRDEAIAQYHACARVLQRELGVAPMPETRALLQRIVAEARPALDR